MRTLSVQKCYLKRAVPWIFVILVNSQKWKKTVQTNKRDKMGWETCVLFFHDHTLLQNYIIMFHFVFILDFSIWWLAFISCQLLLFPVSSKERSWLNETNVTQGIFLWDNLAQSEPLARQWCIKQTSEFTVSKYIVSFL